MSSKIVLLYIETSISKHPTIEMGDDIAINWWYVDYVDRVYLYDMFTWSIDKHVEILGWNDMKVKFWYSVMIFLGAIYLSML